MNKLSVFFALPALIDLIQVSFFDKLEIDFVYLLMAFGASMIGSGVRISYEKQSRKVGSKRVVFILICSTCISYLTYEFTVAYNCKNILGILSIVGGIISVDIIKLFIEDLPSILKQALKNKLNAKDE